MPHRKIGDQVSARGIAGDARSKEVETLRATIRACGMSAPLPSRTTPNIVAVVVCPNIGQQTTASNTSRRIWRRFRRISASLALNHLVNLNSVKGEWLFLCSLPFFGYTMWAPALTPGSQKDLTTLCRVLKRFWGTEAANRSLWSRLRYEFVR